MVMDRREIRVAQEREEIPDGVAPFATVSQTRSSRRGPRDASGRASRLTQADDFMDGAPLQR
jgi:hypothetical protein